MNKLKWDDVVLGEEYIWEWLYLLNLRFGNGGWRSDDVGER